MTNPKNPEAELDGIVNGLGGVIEKFQSSKSNLIAGLVLGIFMAIGGILAANWVWQNIPQPASFQNFGNWILLGGTALLVVAGIWLSYWAISMFSYRVMICQEGIVELRKGRPSVFHWNDVESITEGLDANVSEKQNKSAKRATYIIRFANSKKREFDANRVQKIKRFRELLIEKAQEHEIPWTIAKETNMP